MNTGSNHVGVAAEKPQNPDTKQADTEQKSSTLAHDWPKAGDIVEVAAGKTRVGQRRWEKRKVVGLRGKSILVEGREGAMRASLWRPIRDASVKWPEKGDVVEWWDGFTWLRGKVWKVGGPTAVEGAKRTFNVEGAPGVFSGSVITGGAVYGVHWRWPGNGNGRESQEDTKMTKTTTSIELQTAWTQQFARSSAPDVDEFAHADRGELIELIAELKEWRKDLSRLPDGGAQLNSDFEVATQALADLDAGRRVYRADDDDGAWFLTLAALSEVCAGCSAALAEAGCKECGLCPKCCRGHELPEAGRTIKLASGHLAKALGTVEGGLVAYAHGTCGEGLVYRKTVKDLAGWTYADAPGPAPSEEKMLATTHGKNEVPELPAVVPTVECQQYDCTEVPSPEGAGYCEKHAVELGIMKLPGPRTCRGILIYQSPEESCDCVLGREVKGDRCAVCEEWMHVHGDCDGCMGRLPGWTVTGKLCADCRAVRQAAIRERMADAASGRAEWMVFPPSGDIGAIGIRRDGATFTLAIYGRAGLFEMKPIITSTFGPETTVLEWFREVLR
jgi:hypothetical protein